MGVDHLHTCYQALIRYILSDTMSWEESCTLYIHNDVPVIVIILYFAL